MKRYIGFLIYMSLYNLAYADSGTVSFYSTSDCTENSLIATLPNNQTLESCHDYTFQHGLENTVVKSLTLIPGYCMTDLDTADTQLPFEKACQENATGQ